MMGQVAANRKTATPEHYGTDALPRSGPTTAAAHSMAFIASYTGAFSTPRIGTPRKARE